MPSLLTKMKLQQAMWQWQSAVEYPPRGRAFIFGGKGGTTQPRSGTWVNVPVAALFRKQVSRRAVQLPRLVQAWV